MGLTRALVYFVFNHVIPTGPQGQTRQQFQSNLPVECRPRNFNNDSVRDIFFRPAIGELRLSLAQRTRIYSRSKVFNVINISLYSVAGGGAGVQGNTHTTTLNINRSSTVVVVVVNNSWNVPPAAAPIFFFAQISPVDIYMRPGPLLTHGRSSRLSVPPPSYDVGSWK